MDANMKVLSTRVGSLRVAASTALLGILLGSCSSVPDAVNPSKWYEKTTDFFSGDNQAAATTPAPAEGGNQGLSADPDAPAPAVASTEAVSSAPSGLNADQVAGNYASPPIERQGAATDSLRPESAVASTSSLQSPSSQPTLPVTSAQQPSPMTPSLMADAPPPAPSVSPMSPMSPMSEDHRLPTSEELATMQGGRPSVFSMDGAPPPPQFNAPANALSPYGRDEFETVVINSEGMDTEPQQMPQMLGQSSMGQSSVDQASMGQVAADQSASGSMFSEPGATTSFDPSGMTRVATIHFASSSSMLDERDRSILGAVIQLQRERGGHVVVVGHASSRTRDMDYIAHQMANFQVSMERAATIGNELKDLGLGSDVLEVQAVSDTTPLYMEVMPSGEAGNRRVEIYLAL